MDITFISDTHGLQASIGNIEFSDVLVHSGDISSTGGAREVKEFVDWFISQPHTHKIFIAGNHDLSFELSPKPNWLITILNELPKGVHYLEDNEVVIDGIKFYGAPWQPRFGNWAFNVDRGEEIKKKWDLIPNDTDILITHGPPHGILDYTLFKHTNAGCEELIIKINQIKPKVHAFGHIHEAYGIFEQERTTFINASICTIRYSPSNKPTTFKLI